MSGNFELRHWRPPPPRPKSLLIPSSLHLTPLTPPSSTGNGYTSLSDLITSSPSATAAVYSPTAAAALDIRIRNRLVKQAAYAYLQPTPSSTETSRRRRCFSLRRALASCFGLIAQFLTAIRIRFRKRSDS